MSTPCQWWAAIRAQFAPASVQPVACTVPARQRRPRGATKNPGIVSAAALLNRTYGHLYRVLEGERRATPGMLAALRKARHPLAAAIAERLRVQSDAA